MRSLILAALLALPIGSLQARSSSTEQDPETSSFFEPNIQPILQVRRAAGDIEIDGALDDPGWAGAARATNFAENWPREKGEPPVESEVLVSYDEDNLYLGFIAQDDPSSIRASLRDRDEMWSDDYFGILLDTYGDASWAYFLFANPFGIQGDSRFVSSGGEDDNFDIIYYTEGQITETGYVIEMAIPFKSLRFPDRPVQEWRATFWRTRPRESRSTYTWAAMDRDESCFLCQFGTLAGMEGVRPGGALEIIPSVVTSQVGILRDASDPNSGIENGGVDGDGALGIRYAFPNGITAEVAINQDFSQVESDVAQIDVNTTFALFFPERRPFFQEGSDLFDTFINAVYTRSINDPQVTGRLTARMGRTSFAYIGARDENSPLLIPFEERSFIGQAGRSFTNIGRVKQTLYSNAYVGALFTDRRFEGNDGSGSVFGADGVFTLGQKHRVEWQILGSRTSEPNDLSLTDGVDHLDFARGAHTAAFDGESFWGYAQYTSFERSARTWNFHFRYSALSPTFRADNGFETRNDNRRLTMWQSLAFYPNSSILDQIRPGFFARRSWNFDGVRKRDLVEPTLSLNLKAQTFLNVWYDFGRERFQEIEFDGIRRWGAFVNSNFSDPVKLGFFVSHGRSIARNLDTPVLGTSTDFELFGSFKPHTRLVIQPSLTFSELNEPNGDEVFSGYILRTRTNLQFTRELFLRLVVQYNDFGQQLSIEPLLTYKVNPFTLFFIGSTLAYRNYEEPDVFAQTERQFFAKFQYLLRL
ncbi:MAG: carbohydrate binding family 9 domain-containing protein [Gemmatimonadota bacterium]